MRVNETIVTLMLELRSRRDPLSGLPVVSIVVEGSGQLRISHDPRASAGGAGYWARFGGSRLDWGIAVCIAAGLAMWIFLRFTPARGFELRGRR